MVIWAKTEAGRAEIQARTLVKERPQRNLLLVIDGRKSDDTLLADLAGISADDFLMLESLGLIAPATGADEAPVAALPSAPAAGGVAASPPTSPAASAAAPLDYAQFTAALTRIISKELGLRGFMLTLSVEKASTAEELRAVAERALEQVRDRRGEASAVAARRVLFGA